jgi:hypothetical protein
MEPTAPAIRGEQAHERNLPLAACSRVLALALLPRCARTLTCVPGQRQTAADGERTGPRCRAASSIFLFAPSRRGALNT